MGPQAGQAQHFQVRNMKKEPENVGGGRRGGRKDREDTRERNEKPALIQNMGSIFAEWAQGVSEGELEGMGHFASLYVKSVKSFASKLFVKSVKSFASKLFVNSF